jgi:hypothetical protein
LSTGFALPGQGSEGKKGKKGKTCPAQQPPKANKANSYSPNERAIEIRVWSPLRQYLDATPAAGE